MIANVEKSDVHTRVFDSGDDFRLVGALAAKRLNVDDGNLAKICAAAELHETLRRKIFLL